MKTLFSVTIGILLLTGVLAANDRLAVYAQEEAVAQFVLGVVGEISDTGLTVVDSSSGEDVSTTFVINEGTQLENIASISEIQAGDEVYVDYVAAGDGFAAVNIYKMGMEVDETEGMNPIEDI